MRALYISVATPPCTTCMRTQFCGGWYRCINRLELIHRLQHFLLQLEKPSSLSPSAYLACPMAPLALVNTSFSACNIGKIHSIAYALRGVNLVCMNRQPTAYPPQQSILLPEEQEVACICGQPQHPQCHDGQQRILHAHAAAPEAPDKLSCAHRRQSLHAIQSRCLSSKVQWLG